MLPPRWVRRVVIAPIVVVGIFVGVTALPIALVVALALSPLLPGRWRPLRFLWFLVLYAASELVLLTALFGLWVATGFGAAMNSPWSQRAHYRLVQLFLDVLYYEATRVLGVKVSIEGTSPDVGPGHPIVVLSRHAGAGDSFLLIRMLLSTYDREPRIVLKDTLQWDPAIDTALNRLPNRFITPNPGSTGAIIEERIQQLASQLDTNDALVIFPEGGNFSKTRRRLAIDRLRHKGLTAEAEQAERLRHVLPPRPGGTTAAFRAAPDADAVLVAHTGLEHLSSLGDLWRWLPMDSDVRLRWWRVPAAEVPREPEAVAAWLDEWWARIDGWIHEHQTALQTSEGGTTRSSSS